MALSYRGQLPPDVLASALDAESSPELAAVVVHGGEARQTGYRAAVERAVHRVVAMRRDSSGRSATSPEATPAAMDHSTPRSLHHVL